MSTHHWSLVWLFEIGKYTQKQKEVEKVYCVFSVESWVPRIRDLDYWNFRLLNLNICWSGRYFFLVHTLVAHNFYNLVFVTEFHFFPKNLTKTKSPTLKSLMTSMLVSQNAVPNRLTSSRLSPSWSSHRQGHHKMKAFPCFNTFYNFLLFFVFNHNELFCFLSNRLLFFSLASCIFVVMLRVFCFLLFTFFCFCLLSEYYCNLPAVTDGIFSFVLLYDSLLNKMSIYQYGSTNFQ